MQQKKEEPDPLFYHIPLHRLLRKKTWAAIGSLLKYKKAGIVNLRQLWNREGGELYRLKRLTDAELECLSP